MPRLPAWGKRRDAEARRDDPPLSRRRTWRRFVRGSRSPSYTFHRVAEHWRRGRVFLAGDAAHLMPPFAGQGMNRGGMKNASNLAWKLAAVLRGLAPDAILDTYEVERAPVVRKMVEVSRRLGAVIVDQPDRRCGARLDLRLPQPFEPVPGLHPPRRRTPDRPGAGLSGRLRIAGRLSKQGRLFLRGSRSVEPPDAPGGGAVVAWSTRWGRGQHPSRLRRSCAGAGSRTHSPQCPNQTVRVNDTQRPALAPPQVFDDSGHLVLETLDFDRSAAAGTMDMLGFIPSDVLCLADGTPAGSFMRLDSGDEPSGRPSHAVRRDRPQIEGRSRRLRGRRPRCGGDEPAVLMAKRYRHAWGVGRHLLGSQDLRLLARSLGSEATSTVLSGDLFDAAQPPGYHVLDRAGLCPVGPRSARRPCRHELTPRRLLNVLKLAVSDEPRLQKMRALKTQRREACPPMAVILPSAARRASAFGFSRGASVPIETSPTSPRSKPFRSRSGRCRAPMRLSSRLRSGPAPTPQGAFFLPVGRPARRCEAHVTDPARRAASSADVTRAANVFASLGVYDGASSGLCPCPTFPTTHFAMQGGEALRPATLAVNPMLEPRRVADILPLRPRFDPRHARSGC